MSAAGRDIMALAKGLAIAVREEYLTHRINQVKRFGDAMVERGLVESRAKAQALILAVGSKPFIPPINGLDLPGLMAMRTLDDVKRLKELLIGKSQVMVVGGGLLGLELALMLKTLGKDITVSHLMPSLMETQLSEEAGKFLQKKLEQKGLKFIMGTYITDLLGSTAGVESAVFKNGQQVKTELVLFSSGIRPNIDLAKQCGLNFNKGVVVDEKLCTNDPDIFAIGECIEHKGQIWGLVAPVYEQARTLSAILCGEDASFSAPELPPTRLKSEIPVISMGKIHSNPEDEIALYLDHNDIIFKKLIIRDNRIIGATLVGEDLNTDAISLYFTAKIPLPKRRADILFPGAAQGEVMMDATGWPDDLRVCDCNGVSAGKIRKAIDAGSDTLTKVMNTTKAGTGCGSCKNKIKALLIAVKGELKEDPTDKYYVAGIPMTRDELTAFITGNSLRSASSVFRAIPGSTDDSKTRMGLDFLLNYIWKGDYTVERDSRNANDRYSGNIQKDGRFSVIPHLASGLATPKELRTIADVAEEYGAKIKVTGADRIGIYALDKKDLRTVWKKLQMGSGHAYTKSFRACKACVGNDFCRFGLADSMGLGKILSDRYRGTMGPAKFKMGVSGCPRNCSEATIKDFGAVAVEEGWDIYIGGNAGAKVIAAKKITRANSDEEVVRIADRFYEYYRKHAKYGERSAYFVERVGLETVTDAILNDTEANLKLLETDFQEMLSRYKDPWFEDTDLVNESTVPGSEILDGWVRIGPKDILPEGESRLYQSEKYSVTVFHGRDGSFTACAAKCPHAGGPMSDSIYGGGWITCPLHSYAFDAKTGKCANPEVGDLKIYPVEIRTDGLYVRIGE